MVESLKFDDLLSRADDELLQELLGSKIIKLLNILDTKLSPSKTRDVLVNLKTREGLLLDKTARNALTDLLRLPEAKSLAKLLGATASEEPYALIRARSGAKKNLPLVFEFFKLFMPVPEEQALSPSQELNIPAYPLFSHQRRAARQVTFLLNTEPRRVLLHMPTGAGKTRTAMNVIAEYLRVVEPTVVVWLAHSEELCDQGASEFLNAWKNIGNREINVYRFWGDHEVDLKDVKDGFFIAGLPKTFSRAKKSIKFLTTLGSKTSLVVMDEAHQAIAPTYKLILDALCLSFGGQITSLLGLSATPGRTWDDAKADKELSNFFSRRKVTLEVEGYGNPVDYLVEQKYLAKANYRSLMYQSGLSLSNTDLQYIQDKLDLSDKVLERIAEDDKRNLRIILEIEQMAKRHSRIIVFAISVEHSNLLAATLKARGIHAYSVTGGTPKAVRQKTLADYKSDAEGCRVLCNYGVFTTGFDAPKTSAAVIARPTMSLVLYSQMVGRAIRGTRAGGNDEAEIVTVVDSSLASFGNMSEAFNNWEDIWGDE